MFRQTLFAEVLLFIAANNCPTVEETFLSLSHHLSLCVCASTMHFSLTVLSHTRTHITQTQPHSDCVCTAGGECVGPLINFTPHWSETCDCGSGLCLFLTPRESTGVRGHMQEKHTQIFMHTHTPKHTM